MKHLLQQQVATEKSTGGTARSPRMVEKDWEDAKEGNGETIYFRFSDGEVIECDMNKVSDPNQRKAKFHGVVQKVGDSFAGVKGDIAAAKENCRSTIQLLYSEDWVEEREGGGPRLGELIEAISRIRGVEMDRVRTVVEAAKPEERSAWRSNATVKAEVAKIRLEKAQKELEGQGKQELNINLGR
jgi:hypothetical protein